VQELVPLVEQVGRLSLMTIKHALIAKIANEWVTHHASAEDGSAVGFAAMENAADFDGVGGRDKEEPVIGDAEPEFVSSLKRLHVAFAHLSEALQSGKDAHSGGLVEAADIGFGRFCPNDPLHRALL
jgi:hypothetical protein